MPPAVLERLKTAREAWAARRREVVTINVHWHRELIDIGETTAERAATEGLRGEAARDFVAGEVFATLEGAIQGNPDHWAGRMIERLDDLAGIAAEVGYRMLKAKGVL